MSLQKAFDLSAFDGVEVVLEVDDNVSNTLFLDALDLSKQNFMLPMLANEVSPFGHFL